MIASSATLVGILLLSILLASAASLFENNGIDQNENEGEEALIETCTFQALALRSGHWKNPLSLDTSQPSFSWQLKW